MSNTLSSQVFDRISKLTNTLKLETVELVNKASDPKKDEAEDSTSDDSVILIESPVDVENNSFIKLIRERQDSLKAFDQELRQNYERSCSSVTLEDLVSIAASLHGSIDYAMECICNKMGMEKEELEGFKSPLDDSIPVSLFKSNIKQKYLNAVYDSVNDPENADLNRNGEAHHNNPCNERDKPSGAEIAQAGVHSSSAETFKEVHNFPANAAPSRPEKARKVDVADLNNLSLSEETRKLLGLE
ncbi:conserved hypothetical protein [Theileria orientalis strain Shintoku]|uniref:Uncharacterized protein n=1 Tax=Theileria orientalis strain Shintoku TaxID=869250 RepID=J4DPS2_THEOR|nr:conserved hypothetical protein [Theileria orientalis strain Shintoku]PVC52751.1 hypothetical protein MACL_00000515 [Theileria orientalis]BAM41199.1 conserved hypothetical protein [Theileria orientalis strain Shintoku]|eukprot:XP_009691500.1 conserved hypothetical protein [Theileria orientalis strain Shintoku]